MYKDEEAIDFFENHPDPGSIDLFEVNTGYNFLTIFVSDDYPNLVLVRNNISGGLLE